MMKQHRKTLILTSIITLLPVVCGLLLWGQLPDSIATHWGLDSAANGWSSKPMAVFGIPLFLLAIHWICVLATSADPKNKNSNGKPLRLVLWVCPMVSLLTGIMIYAAALGITLDTWLLMPLFLGVMFIVIGNYLPKCKQNYTIGIKLPWTLASTENWNRTHRFSGALWVVGVIVIITDTFFRSTALLILCIALLAALPVLYSYVSYQRHDVEQ